jgi:diguanylate cyclase (GGDEF)-like protein
MKPLLLASLLGLAFIAGDAVASPVSEAKVEPTAGSRLAWSGLPWITRYTSAEHGAHPLSFAVQPVPGGEVFVANADGLLRYFGGRWQLLDLPDMATTRSLVLTVDGELYVGGYHHFGRLRHDDDGQFRLDNLDERFFPASTGAPLGEIWELHSTSTGTYFGARDELLLLDTDGQTWRWRPENSISRSFQLGEEIWLRDTGGNLLQLVDRQLLSRLAEVPSLVALWRDSSGVLQMLSDERGFLSLDEDGLQARNAAATASLITARPYTLLHTSDGGLLVGCLSGEIYWYGPKLDLRHRWMVSRYPILDMAEDDELGLWIVTEGEILRLDLSPQWRHLGPASGYGGTLNIGLATATETLLGTSIGLYRDDGSSPLQLVGVAGEEVRDLLTVEEGVITAGSAGVHLWRDNAILPIVEDANALWLLRSRLDPDLLYVVEDAGLLIIERIDGRWRESARAVDPAYRFMSLLEDPRSLMLWAGQIDDDPFRISLTSDGRRIVSAERVSRGLQRPPGTDSNVVRYQDEILVGTRSGLFRWVGDHFQSARLTALDPLDTLLKPRFDEMILSECGELQLAATSRALVQHTAGSWSALPLPGSGQGRGVVGVKCAPDGALLATWGGLSWYRPTPMTTAAGESAVPKTRAERPVRLEQALLQRSGRSSERLPLQTAELAIPSGANLSLSFAHPSPAADWTTQSRLWPIEADWQSHASHGQRQLTALSAGRYELQLRAIHSHEQASPLTRFAFTVQPPWHRQWWVQTAVLLLLLGLTWALARWRLRTLEQRNSQLEAVVAERTQSLWQRTTELEAANQRLAALADQDGLTGVANRRRLDHEMQQAFDDSLQGDRAFSLLMIDLDHFKQFNDSHGHQRGDARLRQTAQRMLQALRWPRALLARYGGEEFVAILPDADLDSARTIAEGLRRAAAAAEVAHERQTVSIGLAERRAHGAADASTLLALADKALYAAKDAGRDRVESAPTATDLKGAST